ncbi:hypothetical protein D3C77_219060 [compost metagenome]|jgi:hypothetical protein
MSKPRFLPVFVVCSLLTACASIDKGDAAKLAEEGKATTQEVVRKNDLVAESFITKNQWQLVQRQLRCSDYKDEVKCISDSSNSADEKILVELSESTSSYLALLNKTSMALNKVYDDYYKLATYDDTEDIKSSAKDSIALTNQLIGAANKLSGKQFSPVAEERSEKVGKGLGFIANTYRNHNLVKYNQALCDMSDGLLYGIKTMNEKILPAHYQQIASMKSSISKYLIKTGIVSPSNALTPLVGQVMPGVPMANPYTGNNRKVVDSAAATYLKATGSRQDKLDLAERNKSITDLNKLMDDHVKLGAVKRKEITTNQAAAARF